MDTRIAKSTDKYGNLNSRDPRKIFDTASIYFIHRNGSPYLRCNFSFLFFPLNYVPFFFIGDNRKNIYVNYACVLKIVK